ncbi:hypothetical protein F5Y12DRAFT_721432 [Xylaria sp. FL1777]|nr:hypothetical protein F5Y12DRAFT_721432 [Xylaria sp. FL1777]
MDYEDLVQENRELAIQVGILNCQQDLPQAVLHGSGRQDDPNDRLNRFFACIIRAITTAAAAIVVAWFFHRAGLRWEEIEYLAGRMQRGGYFLREAVRRLAPPIRNAPAALRRFSGNFTMLHEIAIAIER